MKPNDPFLPAIIEKPDDVLLRLAYADWLQARGLTDLAEFIRVLCQRACLPVDAPEQARLKGRERELLAEHASQWFGAYLRHFLQDTPANPACDPQRRDVASTFAALPLMADMGGCYVLRRDGTLACFLWDKPNVLQPEPDPRIWNLALFKRGLTYPRLRLLIPPRPVGSSECSDCTETNRLRSICPNLLCYCGGLGWLPPDGW